MIFYVLLCRYQCKSLPFRNISSPINQNTSNWQACHHLPISELHMKSLRFTLKVTDFDFCLTLKGLHQPQKLIRPYQVFLQCLVLRNTPVIGFMRITFKLIQKRAYQIEKNTEKGTYRALMIMLKQYRKNHLLVQHSLL